MANVSLQLAVDGDGGEAPNQAIALGPGSMAMSAAMLTIPLVVSQAMDLGLGRKLLVAAARCMAQVFVLGLILAPVFSLNSPPLVAVIAVVMVGLASWEVQRTSKRTYDGQFLHVYLILLVTTVSMTVVTNVAIVRVSPWWDARYFVPLLGMLMGNALSGVRLGISTALRLFDEQRQRVEQRLALGADRWEASRGVMRETVTTALIPLITTLSVTGLIKIPGMMTGSILGGEPPHLAARYQVMIMFGIAAVSSSGVVLITIAVINALFDDRHRFHPEAIRRKAASGSGAAAK